MKLSPNENPLDQSLRDVFQDFSLSPDEHPQVWDHVARRLAATAKPTAGRGRLFRLGLPVAGILGVLGGGWLLLAPPAAQPAAPADATVTQARHSPATALPAAQTQVVTAAEAPAPARLEPVPAPAPAGTSVMPSAASRPSASASAEPVAGMNEPSVVQEYNYNLAPAPKKVSELPTPTLPPAPVVKDARKSVAGLAESQRAADEQLAGDTAELEAASRAHQAHDRDDNAIKYRKPSHRLAEPTGVKGWLKRLKKKVQDWGD